MTNWKGILIAAVSSLFLQLAHWIIYEIVEFPAVLLGFTPLLLCAAYHAVQSDADENRRMSRRQFFFGAVFLPLLISILFSLGFFLHDPDMSIYHTAATESDNGFQVTAAVYAGRISMTALYLLLFALIDIPLQRLQENHRNQSMGGEHS